MAWSANGADCSLQGLALGGVAQSPFSKRPTQEPAGRPARSRSFLRERKRRFRRLRWRGEPIGLRKATEIRRQDDVLVEIHPSVFLEGAFEVCEELIGRLGEHAEEEGCGEGGDEDAQAIDEELHQALTAFAGEASAQVVLVAGEGIGDRGAALLEGGVGLAER
jgi:hypothetical protein